MLSDGGNHLIESFLAEHLQDHVMVAAIQELLVADHVSNHGAVGAAGAAHTDLGAVDIQNRCTAVLRQFPVCFHEAHVAPDSPQGKGLLSFSMGTRMVGGLAKPPASTSLNR